MQAFFEYLKEKGLTNKGFARKLTKLKNDELQDLIINAIGFASIADRGDKNSKFNFVANSTLSGGPFPCKDLLCRLKNIDNLARNATLYADTVFIENPFEQYFHVKEFTGLTRLYLALDLTVLYHYKPLFDEGIFRYSSPITHVCNSCLKKMNAFSKSYEKKIQNAELSILDYLLTELTFTIKNDNDQQPQIIVEGSEDLGDHPVILEINNHLGNPLFKRIQKKSKLKLTKKEIIDFGIPEMFITPIINDLITQNHYSNYFNAYYLTNRNIEERLINNNQSKSKAIMGNKISKSLVHSLPFLPDTDFMNLIKLRKKEGEAFEIYRSSLTNFLTNIKSKEHYLKQAFQDEIQPEINRINMTLKNSKKLILTDIGKDLLVGSTFVSVGLFSQFLPPNIGQLVAGLGGINYLGKFGDNVKKLATVETEARTNKYFFVWKLQKLNG
jgi:hypothetical protein